jgi:glycosyltransferase involved in cell wall biosynthesis
MKILIITEYYWPESFAAGVYITELAESLAAKGNQVTVQTSFPHYPEGRTWKAYRKKIFKNEVRNKVNIRRTYLYAVRRDRPIILRAMTTLSFSITTFFSSLFNSKQDIIYTLYPILPLALSSLLISKIKKCPMIFGVKDLSTAGLVESGKLNNRFLAKVLLFIEIRLYKLANKVQVPTVNQLNYLSDLGVKKNNLTLIPDWVDSSVIKPQEKYNNFRKKNLLIDKFLIVYSGNMGYSSDLKTVVKAASLLKKNEEVHFLLVGDGAIKNELVELASSLNLKNVTFLPFQDRKTFIQVLASSDIGLITLNKNFTTVSSQGKMYSILSAGRPILALMNKKAWGVSLIINEKIGSCVEPGNPNNLAKEVHYWLKRRDKLDEMGVRARKTILNNFSRDISVSKFEELFHNNHI